MKRIDPNLKEKISKILSQLEGSIYNLYDAATKDEKTGAYNMRFFKSLFEIEIEKAKRKKQRLSIIVLDIDFFKKLNDKFGHLIGDKVLIELVKSLKKGIRKYDILSRFGGEEFVILLPETTGKRAKAIAERLRKKLCENQTLKRYNVTISLGVTEYKEKDSQKRMIARADKALYLSKKNGRNRSTLI